MLDRSNSGTWSICQGNFHYTDLEQTILSVIKGEKRSERENLSINMFYSIQILLWQFLNTYVIHDIFRRFVCFCLSSPMCLDLDHESTLFLQYHSSFKMMYIYSLFFVNLVINSPAPPPPKKKFIISH